MPNQNDIYLALAILRPAWIVALHVLMVTESDYDFITVGFPNEGLSVKKIHRMLRY